MAKYLTINEAAAFTGLTPKTIRKHLSQGKLCCLETPLGRRILESDLEPYLLQGASVRTDEEGQTGSEGVQGLVLEPTLMRALDLVEVAQRAAHEAQLELRRMERQQVALQIELQGYQRVLGEQAESSQERRAELAVAEQQATRAQELAEELTRQNQAQMQRWQAEKLDLIASVRLYQDRVGWLEQRVPKWVRRVFGAG